MQKQIIVVRGNGWSCSWLGMLVACSGGHANPGKPSGGTAAPAAAPERPPDGFYAVPDPLPPGRPGALIRSVPIAESSQVRTDKVISGVRPEF